MNRKLEYNQDLMKISFNDFRYNFQYIVVYYLDDDLFISLCYGIYLNINMNSLDKLDQAIYKKIV